MSIPELNTYKGYCELLAARDTRAVLLLHIQNLYVQSVERDPWDGEGLLTELDRFLARISSGNPDGCLDRLDHIQAHTKEAVNYLLGHIHEEIIRQHTLLPIGSVREVDTSTLIWLSRLPGRTVREKLAGKRKIKAVARNWSHDTLENRLFKAFLQNMRELVELKEKSLHQRSRDEAEVTADAVNSWLNAEGREIGRYDNLPPNNRLLSDKYYRKIWDGWIWLGELDQMMNRDAAELDKKILEALFWRLGAVIHANSATSLIQLPIKPSSRRLEVRPLWPKDFSGTQGGMVCLKGIVRQKSTVRTLPLSLTLSAHDLQFTCGASSFRATCRKGEISIIGKQGDKTFEKIFSGSTAITDSVRYLSYSLPPSAQKKEKKKIWSSSFVVADIARVKPFFVCADGTPIQFSGRLLGQFFDCGAGVGRIFLHCGTARGLLLSNNTPLIMGEDIFRNADAQDMTHAAASFFEMVAAQIDCRAFQFIIPDDVDDFSLNLSRRQANLYFRNARTLPRSIGALFDYLQRTQAPFSSDAECIIIVGSLLGTQITLTPLIGRRQKYLLTKVPESGGFFWERHPSYSFSSPYFVNIVKKAFGKDFNVLPKAECFSPEDVRDCAEKITLFYGDENTLNIFSVKHYHRENVERLIQRFKLKIDQCRKRLGQYGRLPCYYLAADCSLVTLDEHEDIKVLGKADSVRGALFLSELEAKSDCPPLWQDHIPDLFMRVSKRGVPEDIPIVKNLAVMPRYGETKIINKGIELTLPAGSSRYHFPLTKKEGGNKIRYEALIQSPHFPLSSDLPCSLEMRYTYGAEKPFQLFFQPNKNTDWRYGSLCAEWVNVSEIRRESPIPSVPPEIAWADLRHVPGNRGETDVIAWMTKGFTRFHYIRELHSFWEQRHLGPQALRDEKGTPFTRRCITGFANSVRWRVDKNGKHFCFFPIEGGDIFIHEVDWADAQSSIMESPEIALDVYKNDARSGYKAKNIHAGHILLERHEAYLQKDIGFPPIWIWRNGRSLSDADCPNELRMAAVCFLEDMAYFRERCALRDDTWHRLCLCAARMHRDGPPFLWKGLLEEIEDRPPTFENCLRVGSFLGDLSLPEQRHIHDTLLKYCAKKTPPIALASFKALSIAWWRVPAIVQTLDAKTIAALAAGAAQAFTSILKTPSTQLLGKNAAILCEFVLALLRTRANKDPKISSLLDANGRMARILAEHVEGFMDIHAKTPLTMKSYLELKFTKPPARASLPDLLCATYMYLTGEDGAEDILITGIDEE